MFVLHLGVSGFPGGTAPMQRIRLTFKALKGTGLYPLIINKHSTHPSTGKVQRKVHWFDGISYINTSYFPYRPQGFLARRLNKISGYLLEFLFILGRKKRIHSAIFYGSSVTELFWYRFLSKIFGFKLVIQYVELRSAVAGGNIFFKWNNRLFDGYCYKLCDGAIVISEYLKARLLVQKSTLPVLKVPAISDFDEFGNYPVKEAPGNSYLMYCGTIHYFEVIEFIIDLFCRLKRETCFADTLTLVVSGSSQDKFSALRDKITNMGLDNCITVKSNIDYGDLIGLYKNAKMLFVPLRKTKQDLARFPHKIAEYAASKRPIISTNIGEVAFYFRDMESGILAGEYDIEIYFEKLHHIMSNDELLDEIGLKGYQVGFENFHYKNYGRPLFNFIKLNVR